MFKTILIGLAFLFFAPAGWAAPSDVRVNKKDGAWRLLVDGKAFVVKGVGCNTATGIHGENYLLMAREMGATSVRTWGDATRSYFDLAGKYGLTVDAGVWFNPIRGAMADSYQDPDYREKLKTRTLAYVKEMKDHPALLLWNLGNEVFNFTESETERKAFALFLEDLIQAVHKEDPHHPVIYACASPIDLSYLKAYVPSLDIVGINSYGGYPWVLNWLKNNAYDRPVIATEYGPYGAWDRMKDVNHMPYDPDDHSKAKNYQEIWETIERTSDRSLGGYAFVLGEPRNQDSLTWNNINVGELKREAYWTLYQRYTGKEPANHSPRIRFLKVDRVTKLNPGESIALSVDAWDPDDDTLTYDYFITDIANDPLIVEPVRFYPCEPSRLGAGVARLRVPNDPGVYRVYAQVTDGHGNVAIANRSIEVEPLAR